MLGKTCEMDSVCLADNPKGASVGLIKYSLSRERVDISRGARQRAAVSHPCQMGEPKQIIR